MTSKYDAYWRSRLDDLTAGITQAARGQPAELDISGIRPFGDRQSWQGSARVRADEILSAGMAHVTALARIVARDGLTGPWTDVEFAFTVTPGLKLRIRCVDHSDTPNRREPEPSTVGTAAELRRSVAGQLDPLAACADIHGLIRSLPQYTNPDDVPISNGLYFFYEDGESSAHGPDGRNVRVGNHPKTVDRLVGRLRDHYRTRPNAKNFSVFRRYLGGALLRREDPCHPCLRPSPGHGHWEKQDEAACADCLATEVAVTNYLRDRMRFACLRVDNPTLRNHLEARLIGTLAACPACRPSSSWLGKYCYHPQIQRIGVWNAQFAAGPSASEGDLAALRQLVQKTVPTERLTPAHQRPEVAAQPP